MTEPDEKLSLAPIHFVAVAADCLRKPQAKGRLSDRYRLPDTSALCGEERFAEVALAWSDEGLFADVHVSKPFQEAFYPEVQRGDSVELFIDTRDRKTAGFNTRFSHHFSFFAKPIDGRLGGEITRFRTEDVHEWCDPTELKVTPHLGKDAYSLEILIPAHCLQGYDPEQFERLGFTYRINRVAGSPQHFSVTTRDYQIDQQPSLWSSLRLVK